MAIVYSAAAETARMTAVRDEIDNGGAGKIQIGTALMVTVLAEIDLDSVCGTVTADVLTLSSFPKSDINANATGTAAEARIINGGATDVVTAISVGTTGSDINLDSVNITAGQTLTLDSFTLTHF